VPVEPDQPERTPDLLPADPGVDVGDFRQGTAASRWALARYLVGRAITESVGWALLLVALIFLVLAVAAGVGLHSTFLAVVLAVLAVGTLLMRVVLLGVVRRLTGFERFGPHEDRMRALVDDTSSDVLRELRRIGLPGHVITLPLLAFRFLGRERRADTVARLRAFDTERAVPKARLDELHLLLRSAFRGGGDFAAAQAFGPGDPEFRP
jgi:hypothetical protein